MLWNYIEDNVQKGPITEEQLESLVRTGQLNQDTLVWRDGMAEWQTYGQAKGSTAAPLPIPPAMPSAGQVVCAECKGAFPLDQVIRHGNVFICASCKPIFLQKLKEGVLTPGTMNYAGFGVRFVAKLIDIIVTAALTMPLTFAIQGGFPGSQPPNLSRSLITTPLSILLSMSYYTFLVGKFGATLGKMATKLLIVNPDGSKVSYGKALGRYFAAEFISGCATLCIGYLMVLWDDERRALHDRICSTRVIRK